MKKGIIALMLALIMVLSLAACSSNDNGAADDGEKILHVAESFAYPSLDAHKEYYGWYTSIYGITEALFKMGDDSSVQPCLAEKAEVSDDNLTWTVTLKDGISFSNGNAVTAENVIANLKRCGEVNVRFAQFADYEYKAVSDKEFTITTDEIYPTLVNDLASPEMAIMDLDASNDIDNAPVATGPFVVKSFQPEGTVEVSRNDKYWGGDIKLDGAVFYYMQDDESKLMAMQNGEIDCYTSVTAAAKEIFDASPDKYTVTDIPATRLQFYMLNQNRLSDELRKAINLTVDCDAIASYLNGTVTAAARSQSPPLTRPRQRPRLKKPDTLSALTASMRRTDRISISTYATIRPARSTRWRFSFRSSSRPSASAPTSPLRRTQTRPTFSPATMTLLSTA